MQQMLISFLYASNDLLGIIHVASVSLEMPQITSTTRQMCVLRGLRYMCSTLFCMNKCVF